MASNIPRQRRLFEDDWNLDEELKQFAEAFIQTGDRVKAVLAVRPHVKEDSARKQSYEWIGCEPPSIKYPGNMELLDYIAARRMEIRLRARLEEDELVAMERRVYLHAVGDLPVRKTIIGKMGGARELEVHAPNLAAANAAVEGLRKLGGFGKDLGAQGQEPPVLSQKERAVRLAALLERARLRREQDAA